MRSTSMLHRRRIAATPLLVAGAVVVLQAAFASSSQANPPGNNGTVKIVDTAVDDLNDENSANHPHVSCDFSIRWYGFDEGTRTTNVSFAAQMPSGTGHVDALIGRADQDFTFESDGGGDTLNWSEAYRLDTTGLTEQQNQGFHIKVTITTDHSQGNDTKSKVFWVAPCPTESPTPTPSESPSASPSESPSVSPSVLPTELTHTPSISPSVKGVKIVKHLPFTGPPKTGALTATGVGLILLGILMLLPVRRPGTHQR